MASLNFKQTDRWLVQKLEQTDIQMASLKSQADRQTDG